MAEVTEADLRRADEVCTDMPGVDFDDDGESWREKVAYVAAALAEEREKARAPYEGIADEMREFADRQWDSTEQAIDYFETRIRRAAEVTE